MGETAATGSSSVTVPPAPPPLWRRLLAFARATAKWTTLGYAVLLLVLLPALEWWGERNWLLSLLLYAPAQFLLAPLALLTPFCLVFRTRWILVHAICALGVFFGFMTYRWGERPAETANTLSVVTHNIGEGNRAQFEAFAKANHPDVVLLQDVRNTGADYTALFPGTQAVTRGEFCAISRFPLQRAEVLPKPLWRGRAVAARFEFIREGRTLILYNVHLPTPRSQFNRFLSKRVVVDLVGDEDHAGGFKSYREWIEARRALAEDLADVFARETQPFLACGDFNTPDHGFIYHLFAARMNDAHARTGRGHGMTFPCDVKRLVTLFGPWLRIDYAFAGKGWQPVYCEADTGTRSQHRAVVALFSPNHIK